MKAAFLPGQREQIEAHRDLPRRDYECPVCGAVVHLRAGEERVYFAHKAKQASPDCEEYHPAWDHSGGVEQDEIRLGLMVEPITFLYVRFPGLAARPQSTVRLRDVLTAKLRVVVGDAVVGDAPAPDLLGGTSRIRVAPRLGRHTIEPDPLLHDAFSNVPEGRSCRGLAVAGVLFRRYGAEWLRPPFGTRLRWGDEITLVAPPERPPPEACDRRHIADWNDDGRRWMVWSGRLPGRRSEDVQTWLRTLGMLAVEPDTHVRVLGLPMASRDDVPGFLGDELVVEIQPPDGDETRLQVSADGSGATASNALRGPSFVRVQAQASSIRLHAPPKTTVPVHVHAPPTMEDIRDQLERVPRLLVRLEEETICGWSEPIIFRDSLVLDLSVSAAAATARVDVVCRWRDRATERRRNLQLEDAAAYVRKVAKREVPCEFTIDAGNLGRVSLRYLPKSTSEQREPRVRGAAAWLDAVAASGVLSRSATHALRRGLLSRINRSSRKALD